MAPARGPRFRALATCVALVLVARAGRGSAQEEVEVAEEPEGPEDATNLEAPTAEDLGDLPEGAEDGGGSDGDSDGETLGESQEPPEATEGEAEAPPAPPAPPAPAPPPPPPPPPPVPLWAPAGDSAADGGARARRLAAARFRLQDAIAAPVRIHEEGVRALADLEEAIGADDLLDEEREQGRNALRAKVLAEVQSSAQPRSSATLKDFAVVMDFAVQHHVGLDESVLDSADEVFKQRLLTELAEAMQARDLERLNEAIEAGEESEFFNRFSVSGEGQQQFAEFNRALEAARGMRDGEVAKQDIMGQLAAASRGGAIIGHRNALQRAKEARCSPSDLRPYEQVLEERERKLAALQARLAAAVAPIKNSPAPLNEVEFTELRDAFLFAERANLIVDDNPLWLEGRLALREAHRRWDEIQ